MADSDWSAFLLRGQARYVGSPLGIQRSLRLLSDFNPVIAGHLWETPAWSSQRIEYQLRGMPPAVHLRVDPQVDVQFFRPDLLDRVTFFSERTSNFDASQTASILSLAESHLRAFENLRNAVKELGCPPKTIFLSRTDLALWDSKQVSLAVATGTVTTSSIHGNIFDDNFVVIPFPRFQEIKLPKTLNSLTGPQIEKLFAMPVGEAFQLAVFSNEHVGDPGRISRAPFTYTILRSASTLVEGYFLSVKRLFVAGLTLFGWASPEQLTGVQKWIMSPVLLMKSRRR